MIADLKDCDNAEANARLIAAAPDLLAALELARAQIITLHPAHDNRREEHEWRDNIQAEILDTIDAAIGKARS